MVGGASKELTVYAYQGFPALLSMQAPPVVLREVGYRPLQQVQACFLLLSFHGHENSPGSPRVELSTN